LMQPDVNCQQLCTDWSALYFSSEYGCTGNVVDGNVSFCPDTEAVETWTVQQELEYEGMHPHREELEVFDLEVFDRLTLEREIKLSVHPWKNLPVTGYHVPDDRRRFSGTASYRYGSISSFTCFGTHSGWYQSGSHGSGRPTSLYVRYGIYIDALTFYYPRGRYVRGGGHGGRGEHVTMPRCTNVVLVKSGALIDAVFFIGNGRATRYYGGIGGYPHIVMAPAGRCLGDIQIRYGRFINQICLKFNA